jgi:hypothetical protein
MRIGQKPPAPVKHQSAHAAHKSTGTTTPVPATTVAEPKGGHKGTHWISLTDYLQSQKDNGTIGPSVTAALFSKADGTIEATGRDNEQQTIGDCFWCSSFSSIAMHDKPLMKEHIRQVGTMPDGTNLYGVVLYAKAGSDQSQKFQRAASDVTRTGPDGQPVTYTPVWVVVSDKVAVDKDGDIDTSAVVVAGKNKKVILGSMLSEKAAALFVGDDGYKKLDKGGDAAEVMEMMTGFPASTVNVDRDMDPTADKKLADAQFKSLLDASRSGQQFVLGTWGNAKPNSHKSLEDNDSIGAVLKYPQFTPDGKVAPDGFFKKNFVFQDGDGAADHGMAKRTTGEGAGLVGDHDYAGIGAFEDGKFKGLDFDGTCPIIELRNPWGTTRPAEFSDGRADDDGVVRGPWYVLRTLVGTISIGGRPADQRQSLQGVTAPTLPPGATSTFQLVEGETPAGGDGFQAPQAQTAAAKLQGALSPQAQQSAHQALAALVDSPIGES